MYIERKAPEHVINAMKQEIDSKVLAKCKSRSKRILVGSTLFHMCLCNYKFPQYNYYFRLYKAFEKGFLPFEGCYTEQPSKVIEIISFIEYTYTEVLAEMKRRQK